MTNFNFLTKFNNWLGELSSRMSLVGVSCGASGARVAPEAIEAHRRVSGGQSRSKCAAQVRKANIKLLKAEWLKYAAAIMLILTIGVGNVWGDETLYETIVVKDNSSDDKTAYTTSTAISTAFESPTDSIKAITSVTRVFPGNGGWKFGNSSSSGTITFSLTNTIKKVTKIVINAKRYHATKGTTLDCNSIGSQTLTTSFADYTFTYTTATDVSSITISDAKASSGDTRCYVKSIKIYYDKPSAGTSVTLSKVDPDNGSFCWT